MSIASQLSFSTATSVLAGTAGALLYQSAADKTAFLTIGTSGYVLTSNGSVPGWSLASGITSGASTQVQTVLQTANASYYPTFVNANNVSATAMSVYTTSSFSINPQSGNVNIGNSGQPAKFYVELTGQAGMATFATTASINFAASARMGFSGLANNSDGVYFGMGAQGSGIPAGFGFFREASGWNTALAFYTNNVTSGPWSTAAMQEKMRITSSGQLLLNTNSISGEAPAAKAEFVTDSAADLGGNNSVLRLSMRGNTGDVAGTLGAGLEFAQQYAATGVDASLIRVGSIFGYKGQATGNFGGGLAFYVQPVGATPMTRTMTLDMAGNVGIGITSPNQKLTVQSDMSLYTANDTTGTTSMLLGSSASMPQGIAMVKATKTAAGAGYLTLHSATGGTLFERIRITALGGVSFGTAGTAIGTAGQVLQSNGDAAPTWVAASGLASGQVSTIAQTANATYYPTFVDANNASATAESFYTTSSFNINPSTGNVSIGTTVAPGANGRGITIYTSDYPRLSFRNSTTGDATTDGSQLLVSGSDFYIQNQEAGALIFNTTSIERMRITAGGYIGIGNIASPGTLLSNTATRHGNADGLSAHLNSKQWEVSGQGYASVVSNISVASANVNGGLLVKLGSTDVTDKILDLESGGVNRVRVLGNGNVGIGTGATAPAYKLEVNGSFAATTKSFVINHPTKPGMKLRYGSLEGPENGIYVRGKLTGSNKIELPEY